jgi:catechol 2,3-dioxygenase-like lactoylglutathione lyase family enzyme
MYITIHQTFLPHDDPDASLAFYRDTLGFEAAGQHIGLVPAVERRA